MDSSRLIIDGMHSGPHNMAVDETLLESAIERGIATVRIYAWSEPTVSLGYFQRAEEAHADPQFAGLATVRRLSGGGAILHHHEITYSIALPASHPALFLPLPREPHESQFTAIAGEGRGEGQHGALPTSLTPNPSPAMDPQQVRDAVLAGEGGDGAAPLPHPSRLYRLAHEAVIQVLAESIDAAPPAGRRLNGTAAILRLRGDHDIDPPSSILHPRNAAPDPFLCFGRGDPHDIVLGPHKIVGSAQRRRRGAVLQHGSILLQQSPHAPEFPGIHELCGVELPAAALAEACGRRIALQLGGDWRKSELSPAEHERVAELIATRYTENNDMTSRIM